jgi:hypothetical protein
MPGSALQIPARDSSRSIHQGASAKMTVKSVLCRYLGQFATRRAGSLMMPPSPQEIVLQCAVSVTAPLLHEPAQLPKIIAKKSFTSGASQREQLAFEVRVMCDEFIRPHLIQR